MLGEPVHSYKCKCTQNQTEQLCQKIDSIINKKNIRQSLLAIGISVPGVVHQGIVSNIPTVPEWESFNLQAHIFKTFGLPVVIENDIKTSTIGMHKNYSNNHINNMLFLYLNKGIGAGVIIENKLYRSGRNFAGELAHMNIGGAEQPCNLEDRIVKYFQEGNMDAVIDIVTRLIVNISCLLDPDMVVIDSSFLTQSHIADIEKRFIQLLNRAYLPEIALVCLDEKIYQKGMYSLCMSKTQNSVSITI